MKLINTSGVVFLLLFINAYSFGQTAYHSLTPGEQSLALAANIDQKVLEIIRAETDSAFSQLTSVTYVLNQENNSYVRQIVLQAGIVFGADAESSYNIILKLKERLRELGHLIFIHNKDKINNRYTIAVIRSGDQFDIIKISQTNGDRYNISNAEVIDKLQIWHKSYPFEIIGAGGDWVEAIFKVMPVNMEDFANDIYQFCPDVVDGGSGSVKFLAQEMKDTGILYLWWK